MQSKRKGDIIFIRLFPGEDVNDELKKACKNHDVKTSIVLSGIGQLNNVKLGYFNKEGDYSPENFEKPHELLSLTGNICNQDDEYVLHLHAVLGNERKNAIGGHFIDGKVTVTGEIVLLKTDIIVRRVINEKTGLKYLSLE
jgi:predicted DNA-binding protein with PD1-like motif